MRRVALAITAPVLSALFVLPLAGCVSRSKLRESEALLAECRTDKVSAQQSSSSCEERFAREVKRWEDMDAVVASVVPGTLAQFRAEREEILKLVPETTRGEVEQYIDQLTDAMGRGFQVLRDQNESTTLQLEVAQTKLDALQASTDTIGTQTSSINDTLEGSLREAIEAQRRMRQQAIELVGTVQQFDQSYLSIKESDSRLKLNRNQRETIEQFHAKLIGQLTALGSSGSSTDAPAQEEPASAAETGTDPAG
jgi:chromosome segregation ATPase